MRKTVVFTTILFVILGITSYMLGYSMFKEDLVSERIQFYEEPDVSHAETDPIYYMMEESGVVNVYLNDKKTIYEFTEIKIKDLPYHLQEEIKNGKEIYSERELYDFLENYSS